MRYPPLVQAHFDQPRNAGPLPGPGPLCRGAAGTALAGARIVIEARITAGRIGQIAFQAFGCPWTIAACSLATGRLAGAPAAALGQFDPAALAAELEMPAERLGRLLILQDALRNCLADWDTTHPAGPG
jgi:NifU-like protein involved in Fe-S cluster formation